MADIKQIMNRQYQVRLMIITHGEQSITIAMVCASKVLNRWLLVTVIRGISRSCCVRHAAMHFLGIGTYRRGLCNFGFLLNVRGRSFFVRIITPSSAAWRDLNPLSIDCKSCRCSKIKFRALALGQNLYLACLIRR